METLPVLQTTWFFLIGIIFIGYSLLDGFDLGIGSLLPAISRDDREIGAIFTAIGPVWDGNEVWLLTGGGALFAAFPHVYATVFSGFYLALMLVLFALIFRAVSLEFWAMDTGRRWLWKWTFVIGSFLPSVLFGVALGNVILGIPMNENMDYTGSFFTLLRPFPLALGLLGLTAILMQGSTYSAVKTTGAMQERSRKVAGKVWIAYCAMLLISAILSGFFMPGNVGNPLAWACTGLGALSLVLLRMALSRGKDLLSFMLSSVTFISLWGIAGAVQFPNLVNALQGAGKNLTIYNSSSSELTLKVMLIITAIGMPIVIAYTAFVYRIFRGKVEVQ